MVKQTAGVWRPALQRTVLGLLMKIATFNINNINKQLQARYNDGAFIVGSRTAYVMVRRTQELLRRSKTTSDRDC